jgi:hypothetical protein
MSDVASEGEHNVIVRTAREWREVGVRQVARRTEATLAAAAIVLACGSGIAWSADAVGAAPARVASPECTVTFPNGATNTALLQLQGGEVLCDGGMFTNKNWITVANGGSAVIEVAHLVNDGGISVPAHTSLELTSDPSNLVGATLTGGSWLIAGMANIPGEIATLSARMILSGDGELEDSTAGTNAMGTLAKISADGTFELDHSAYLQTGSVVSEGKIVLGTEGDSGDAVNWQDSGTFAMSGGSFTFLDPNSCINVGSREFTITGGTMSGYGMLTGTVSVSGSAVFAPTLSGGQAAFWLNGSYTQTGGVFEDSVADPTGTPAVGNLAVSGPVTLGGTLAVQSSGDRPAEGTSLPIIGGSSLNGHFSAVHNSGVAGFSVADGTSSAAIVTMASAPPSSPRIGVARVAGTDGATVEWNAPASNGGEPLTGYVISAAPACACKGLTAGPSAKSAVVTGLVAGATYTFVVEAVNSVGTGVASSASNPVTVPKHP